MAKKAIWSSLQTYCWYNVFIQSFSQCCFVTSNFFFQISIKSTFIVSRGSGLIFSYCPPWWLVVCPTNPESIPSIYPRGTSRGTSSITWCLSLPLQCLVLVSRVSEIVFTLAIAGPPLGSPVKHETCLSLSSLISLVIVRAFNDHFLWIVITLLGVLFQQVA